MRPVRSIGPLALSLLAALVVSAGCADSSPPAKAAAPPAPVPTAIQPQRDIQAVESPVPTRPAYPGSVRAVNQIAIVPKVTGRIVKMNVDAGSVVKTGDTLFEVERAPQEAQLAWAQAGLASAQARLRWLEAGPRSEVVAGAEANVEAARQRLALVERGGRPEQVAQAEAGLRSAQAHLAEIRRGRTAAEIQQSKLALDQAKNTLWAAQIQRDGLCGNGQVPEYQCRAGDAQVAAAQTAVDQAQARHAEMNVGPTAEQVAQAESAVQAATAQVALARSPNLPEEAGQARAAVRAAEAQFALARKPVSDAELDVARAEVEQARATVALAKLELAETTVRAPFDGIVAERMVSEGSLVGPTVPTITLLSESVEVAVDVDEAALLALRPGQQARVTTPTTSAGYPATVAFIPPTVDPRTRTGQVRLRVESADTRLRAGMFAQVTFESEGASR